MTLTRWWLEKMKLIGAVVYAGGMFKDKLQLSADLSILHTHTGSSERKP